MNQRLLIIGAGGHAKVVAEVAQAAGFDVVGFLDQAPVALSTRILSIPVLGDESVLESLNRSNLSDVIAVGDNATRESIAVQLLKEAIPYARVLHPSAVISPSAQVGEGTVAMAGVVVNAGAVVGNHCILNTSASVDHDCVLTDFVHVSPGAHLAGQCTVGKSAHVGIGAIAISRVSIGDRAVIGAGAAVISDIPADTIAVGIPAEVIQ